MKISSSRSLSQFVTTFQFNEQLTFDTGKFYEFEFNYLLSPDVCELEDLEMVVFLYDLEAFEEILFRFNSSDEYLLFDQWNNIASCFKVLGRNYQLQINASSTCTINGNKAFIAVDNIILREKVGDNLNENCLDIEITERTRTTTVFTTLETDETTIEETTIVTDQTSQDTTQDTSESFSTSSPKGFFYIFYIFIYIHYIYY